MKILLFGCGKIAEVYAALIESEELFDVAGFTVDRAFLDRDRFLSRPVVPFEDVREHFPPAQTAMAIAIGYHDANRVRAAKFEAARNMGYRLPPVVSRHAWTPPGFTAGEGAIVMDRVSVQAGASIGANAAVWSGTVVGHHARIGEHCWIASNSTIGSSTTVGARCLFGLGVTIGHGIELGDGCFIGASAVVTKSAMAEGVYIARDTERFRLNHDDFLRITRMR